jgi:hypothetical protein
VVQKLICAMFRLTRHKSVSLQAMKGSLFEEHIRFVEKNN